MGKLDQSSSFTMSVTSHSLPGVCNSHASRKRAGCVGGPCFAEFMNLGLASLVVDALNLPEWAPRALRRIAFSLLAGVMLIRPDSFSAGVRAWTVQESRHLIEQIAPVLVPTQPVSRHFVPEGDRSRHR